MDQATDLYDTVAKGSRIEALYDEMSKAESTRRKKITDQTGYKLRLRTRVNNPQEHERRPLP